MTVSEYVKYSVACASLFGFLRSSGVFPATKFVQELFLFLSASIVIGIFVIANGYLLSDWLYQNRVGHGDVVQLGNVTDDLFCFSNSIVSIQPKNGL